MNSFTRRHFYIALLHIGIFKEESSLYTWLCAIAKNEWRKECRRNMHFTLIKERN